MEVGASACTYLVTAGGLTDTLPPRLLSLLPRPFASHSPLALPLASLALSAFVLAGPVPLASLALVLVGISSPALVLAPLTLLVFVLAGPVPGFVRACLYPSLSAFVLLVPPALVLLPWPR